MRVRGGIHHARVRAKPTVPIASMRTLIGRRAAAFTIRRRSSGESGAGPSAPGGPGSGSRRSGTVIFRTFQRRQEHPSADLEPERLVGVALVYGEAQPPVRVGYQNQLARLGRPEGLDVADGHLAVPGVDHQLGAVLEPRFLLRDREPGVAEAVYGDDPGRETAPRACLLDVRRSEPCQGRGVRGLAELR